jgi:hypothetical protein
LEHSGEILYPVLRQDRMSLALIREVPTKDSSSMSINFYFKVKYSMECSLFKRKNTYSTKAYPWPNIKQF